MFFYVVKILPYTLYKKILFNASAFIFVTTPLESIHERDQKKTPSSLYEPYDAS